MDRFQKAALACERLCRIMAQLRAPGGCPWDRKQTLETLRSYLLEETYEVLAAIDRGDPTAHREELGDLLLQVVFQTEVTAETAGFGLAEVADAISDKLVRRHPHVFADSSVEDAPGALRHWEAVKAQEGGGKRGRLDGVPPTLPALLRATRVSEKAASIGFDWSDAQAVWEKAREEWQELESATREAQGAARVDEELGDLLFVLANLARHLDLDAESVLRRATEKFSRRFRRVEQLLADRGLDAQKQSSAQLEALWQEAKAAESSGS